MGVAPRLRLETLGWVGASEPPDLPARSRSRSTCWGGVGGFLFPHPSLRGVSEPLLPDAQEGQRGGWVGAAGLGPSCGPLPALALWRWAGLFCGLFAPSLASMRPPPPPEGRGDRGLSGGCLRTEP